MWQWIKNQGHTKDQRAKESEQGMSGREILKKIHDQMRPDDYHLWLESKLADLLDRSQILVDDHLKQRERYTDAGHSNCISSLRQFVNGVVLDIDEVTQKIEVPKVEQNKSMLMSGKGRKAQRFEK